MTTCITFKISIKSDYFKDSMMMCFGFHEFLSFFYECHQNDDYLNMICSIHDPWPTWILIHTRFAQNYLPRVEKGHVDDMKSLIARLRFVFHLDFKISYIM